MAEAPETGPPCEPLPSSSHELVAAEVTEDEGPLPKRRRMLEADASERLEYRLGGILCCAVCLDLPQSAVYQCINGHLMCVACFTHLLADARLREESATCPNCRVEISKTSASRNLAVEKTVSELPLECKYCTSVFPRHSLPNHEENQCEERSYKFSQLVVSHAVKRRYLDSLVRIVAGVYSLLVSALRSTHCGRARRPARRRLTSCRFACIGCPWRGPAHEGGAHEAACAHPNKSAAEVLEVIAERERLSHETMAVYNQVMDLLSYEKITFTDLQLKPYRLDEFVHKMYYESSRFTAFSHQWLVKAFVNRNQQDPTQSSEREITYQLIMKSKPMGTCTVQWVVVSGPLGEARLAARLAHHAFSELQPDAPPAVLPLVRRSDANRLLANKALHFRLIMFLCTK